jgi:hypothetical protein
MGKPVGFAPQWYSDCVRPGKARNETHRAAFNTTAVIAGFVPATPIIRHGGAFLSGVAGTSPAMTTS